jgi:hypothetical protein
MKLKDFSHGLGHGLGVFARGTGKVLSWPGRALGNTIGKMRPVSAKENIRALVIEELVRLVGTERLDEEKFEQRFKVMAETILALQKRIDVMVASGHVSETDMLNAMDSLEGAEALTGDERTVLVNIFRQNIALQKPELVGTADDGGI